MPSPSVSWLQPQRIQPIDQAKQQRTLSFSFEAGAPFDWSQAKTFAFAPSEGEHRDLYDIVYGQIAGLLEARGLTQQASGPDLILECSRSEAGGRSTPLPTGHFTQQAQSDAVERHKQPT